MITSSSSISKSLSSNVINNEGNNDDNNPDYDIQTLISNFISTNLNSSIISQNDNIKVALTASSTSLKEQLKTSTSAIDLGDCADTLKNYYNIPGEQDLIILNKELNNNNESSTLNNNNEIEVYDYSGRKLNLSVCQEEITVVKYIGDAEELDIETAMDYAELGIDIYNASSEFFNDLCYQYDNEDGADITMEDRRNEVYQNVSFCQDGCSYEGIDYELMTVKCICNADSLQSESQNTTVENEQSELSHFESLVKTFISNWFDLNFEVIYCYNLVFYGPILIKNIGFFFMASMFTLQIIFLGVFFIKRLKPIENYLLNPNQSQIKLNQTNPPKKDEEKQEVQQIRPLKLRSRSIKNQKLNNFNNQNVDVIIEEYNIKDTYNNNNINNNLNIASHLEDSKFLRTRNNKSLSISQFEPVSQKYLNNGNYEKEKENKIKINNFATTNLCTKT